MSRSTYKKKKRLQRKKLVYFDLVYVMKCKLCFIPKYTVVKAAGSLQIYKT